MHKAFPHQHPELAGCRRSSEFVMQVVIVRPARRLICPVGRGYLDNGRVGRIVGLRWLGSLSFLDKVSDCNCLWGFNEIHVYSQQNIDREKLRFWYRTFSKTRVRCAHLSLGRSYSSRSCESKSPIASHHKKITRKWPQNAREEIFGSYIP